MGIDEHLQVLAAFSLNFSEDDEVTSWGTLEESLSSPLFKLSINSSLHGELYLEDPRLT